MGNYEYNVIPTPRKGKRVKGAKTPADRFANVLTDAINAQAAMGWEFVRSETLPMEAKPGLFKKSVETFQSVIVFRREIPAAVDEARILEPTPMPIVPPIGTTDEEPVDVTNERKEPTFDDVQVADVSENEVYVPPIPEPPQPRDPIKDVVQAGKKVTRYWD